MATDPTSQEESVPDPGALPTLVNAHVFPTGNASIFSNWDQPLPPRRSPPFDLGGAAEPPFPLRTTRVVADTAAGIEVAAAVGAFAINGGQADLILKRSSFETLEARVAVLEAALAARPAAVGHNRGPHLDDNLSVDEAGIQNLITLLKQQRATAPIDLPRLAEAARVADPAVNKWQERIDILVKGLLFGVGKMAGEEITKQLEHAGWLHSVYSALQAVFEALMSWINLF